MIDELTQVIGNVVMMGGDLVSEMLAPSEIRDIAASVLASGMVSGEAAASAHPSHLAWMADIPPHLRDCFNG